MKEILVDKIFKRFVVLSCRHGQGTIDGIYDDNYKLLYREI